jgi:hypothetical protein
VVDGEGKAHEWQIEKIREPERRQVRAKVDQIPI